MGRVTPRRIFGAALVGWLVVGFLALVSGPPLGHDEAAYAVAARGDAPAWHYRSTGMIAIARVGLAVGDSAFALRTVALLAGTSILFGAFLLGRAAFDERTGAWAALVLATAHPMASRASELIGDLPATGCLLAACGIAIGELGRERARWRLVAAAPLFAAAFYIRYGSAPVIAMAAALLIVLYAKKLAQWPVLVTAAAFIVLLLPYVRHSLEATGSMLGVLEASAAMPRRAYVGEGLVTYLTSNPFVFYGALVAPTMLAGLIFSWPRRHAMTRSRAFVIVLALGQIVSLGLQSHGQPRYVFFATVLLVIAGVDTLRHFDRPRLAIAAVALAWTGLAIGIVPFQHHVRDLRAPLYAAADAIRTDAGGRPCAIAANVAPQLIWATRCQVVIAKTLPKLPEPWPPGAARYLVSAPHAVLPAALLDQIAPARKPLPVAYTDQGTEAQAWIID